MKYLKVMVSLFAITLVLSALGVNAIEYVNYNNIVLGRFQKTHKFGPEYKSKNNGQYYKIYGTVDMGNDKWENMQTRITGTNGTTTHNTIAKDEIKNWSQTWITDFSGNYSIELRTAGWLLSDCKHTGTWLRDSDYLYVIQ